MIKKDSEINKSTEISAETVGRVRYTISRVLDQYFYTFYVNGAHVYASPFSHRLDQTVFDAIKNLATYVDANNVSDDPPN